MLRQETFRNFFHGFPLAKGCVFLFYGALLAIIGSTELPEINWENFVLRRELFAGNEARFPIPGSEFSIFRPYLPEKGAVSFMMDTLYHPYAPSTEKLYTAQSYLVPLVVNADPTERRALIYCSKGLIANVWMLRAGYRPLVNFAEGQCVAEKR